MKKPFDFSYFRMLFHESTMQDIPRVGSLGVSPNRASSPCQSRLSRLVAVVMI